MADPLFCAWRFTHPDFRLYEKTVGLSVDRSGRIAMVDDNASVRQAILLLLTTMPGERVMRPRYGCDLHRLVFSPNDATSHGLAMHYVRTAISRWEPRVNIIRLDARCDETNTAKMLIELDYLVRRTAHRDTLLIPFDLEQETP